MGFLYLGLFLISIIGQQKGAECYKILFIPAGNLSQFIEMSGLGRALIQRGHEVHVLFSKEETLPDRARGIGYKVLNHKGPFSMPNAVEQDLIFAFGTAPWKALLQGKNPLKGGRELFTNNCRGIAEDEELKEKLRAEKYDFAVVNYLYGCGYLIVKYLQINYASTLTMFDVMAPRWSIIPSIHRGSLELLPRLIGLRVGTEYRFIDRLVRFFVAYISSYMMGFVQNMVSELESEFNTTQSPSEIASNSGLFLLNYESLLTGDPLPEQGNLLVLGGLGTEPAQPIKNGMIKSFADNATKGLIVFTMGSFISALPEDRVLKIFTAMEHLKQRLIMRLHPDITSKVKSIRAIPENVMLMDWLPQNDLLGHKNTVLFIGHCGNNGRIEALYHGVPMLAMPVVGDQWANAQLNVQNGYGLLLKHYEFSADDFKNTVLELIHNETYRKTAKRAAAIFHSRRPPAERAADAIEHAIEFGTDHLRPHGAYSLSFWQIYMVDIFFFFYTFVLLSIVGCFCCCKCTVRKLKKRILKEQLDAKAKKD